MYSVQSLLFTEMEILHEGRNFRLIQDSELCDVLVVLDQYLPESLKVKQILSARCRSEYKPL